MTAYINKLKDVNSNQQLPVTHERAVRDDNGTTAETKFQNLEGAMDKAYVANSNNGMGRITLHKNIVSGVNTLTQSMMQATNTIYVIQYDFTLGEDITIPANCVLEFDGGSISAGSGQNMDTITGTNTGINAGLVKIFSTDVTLAGTWNVAEAYPEWFGAKGDGITDDTMSIQAVLDTNIYNIKLQNKTYCIKSNSFYKITSLYPHHIIGNKAILDVPSSETTTILLKLRADTIIDGCTFKTYANRPPYTDGYNDSGWYTDSTDSVFSNVKFIFTEDDIKLIVKHCYFENSFNDVFAFGANTEINNCTSVNSLLSYQGGIEAKGCLIKDSKVTSSQYGNKRAHCIYVTGENTNNRIINTYLDALGNTAPLSVKESDNVFNSNLTVTNCKINCSTGDHIVDVQKGWTITFNNCELNNNNFINSSGAFYVVTEGHIICNCCIIKAQRLYQNATNNNLNGDLKIYNSNITILSCISGNPQHYINLEIRYSSINIDNTTTLAFIKARGIVKFYDNTIKVKTNGNVWIEVADTNNTIDFCKNTWIQANDTAATFLYNSTDSSINAHIIDDYMSGNLREIVGGAQASNVYVSNVTFISPYSVYNKGPFANRPAYNVPKGFAYFATDKGQAGVGAMIYYTGDNTTPWVYADGTAVS